MKLVVHIPKTAGTSFRWALENYFGKLRVIRDYGPTAVETSDVVRKCLYAGGKKAGSARLIGELSSQSAEILIGHFPFRKYSEFFRPRDIITFIRDPLTRSCSEYIHRTENESFRGSFADFATQQDFQNTQWKFLRGIPEGAMLCVTEQYAASLRWINRAFQWDLQEIRKNVSRGKGGAKFALNLSEAERELFYKKNKKELDLYRNAIRQAADLALVEPGDHRFSKWF